MGDGSHFVFRQKLLGEDGSFHGEAARSVLAKVWGDVFPLFTQSPLNVPVEPGIHILPVGTNSLCTFHLTSKKVLTMLLTLLFTCLAFFWPW